jgi:hypothetical protein
MPNDESPNHLITQSPIGNGKNLSALVKEQQCGADDSQNQ